MVLKLKKEINEVSIPTATRDLSELTDIYKFQKYWAWRRKYLQVNHLRNGFMIGLIGSTWLTLGSRIDFYRKLIT